MNALTPWEREVHGVVDQLVEEETPVERVDRAVRTPSQIALPLRLRRLAPLEVSRAARELCAPVRGRELGLQRPRARFGGGQKRARELRVSVGRANKVKSWEVAALLWVCEVEVEPAEMFSDDAEVRNLSGAAGPRRTDCSRK